jgi:hypothetical protein
MSTVYTVRCDVREFAIVELSRPEEYALLPRFDGSPCAVAWPSHISGAFANGRAGAFAYLTAGALVCQEHAQDVLRLTLGKDAEWLPLRVGRDTMLVLNPLPVVDVLDRERSDLVMFSTGRVLEVQRYVFRRATKLPLLFRVPEVPLNLLATDMFRELVERHGLDGLTFKEA